MKKLFFTGLIITLMAMVMPLSSFAQESQRSVGPANFYISIKDKIGITNDQEKKLLSIEEKALQKLNKLTPSLTKARQTLGALTREDNIDLNKTRELLKSIANLEADGKFIIIEAIALEKKVLTTDQLREAEKIAADMVRGHSNPHTKGK